MFRNLIIFTLICFSCFSFEAEAATKQVVLRWCLPITGKHQNGVPVNFQWSGGESSDVKTKIEEVLNKKTQRKIMQARSSVKSLLGLSLGKGAFTLSGVINNKNLADTTCSDPTETNSQVEFAVAIYDRVILLVGSVEGARVIQSALGLGKAEALLKSHGTMDVIPGKSLGELVAGDARFRNFLKLSAEDLKAWGPKMSYVIRYDRALLGKTDFSAAGITEPKAAVEAGLERIGQMVLGQISSLGIVPGGSTALPDIKANIDHNLPEFVTPVGGGVVGVETTVDGDLLITYSVGAPLLKTELQGNNFSDSKVRALNDQFIHQSGGSWVPEDRLATHRYVFPTKYDELRDELYLEGQEGINVAVPSVNGDTAIFDLVTEPESGPRFLRFPIELGYSTQNDLRISLGVDLKEVAADGNFEELDFALTYEDGQLSGRGAAAWRLADNWLGGQSDGVNLNLRAFSNTINASYGLPTGLDLVDTRNILEISLTSGHDSMSQAQFQRATNPYLPSLGQNRWYGFHEVGLRYQDVSFGGQDSGLLPFAGGEALGPFADGWLNYSTFSPFSLAGAGNIEFALSYELFWGLGAGSTDSFFRGVGDASARFALNLPGGRSGYFRLRGFAGLVDDMAPEYAFIDASSSKFFDGFGTQEIMGQRVYGLTGELGIDLSGLLSRVSNGEAAESTASNSDETAGAVGATQDINPVFAVIQPKQSIYLAGFASLGQVRDMLVSGVAQSGSKALESYGVKVVMRQVTADGRGIDVELGYAYSPQSNVHKSGVMFVGVSSTF